MRGLLVTALGGPDAPAATAALAARSARVPLRSSLLPRRPRRVSTDVLTSGRGWSWLPLAWK